MFKPNKIIELENKKKNKEKKFTVSKLLLFVPLTAPAYRDIKAGISFPKVNILERIAIFYGVDMNYFFDIETKNTEVESVSVRMTDGNEYMLKRFEELVAENALLKKKVEELRTASLAIYPMSDVQTLKVAETTTKLNE